MPHRLTSETIQDEAKLRALLGEPTPIVCSKVSDRVNRLTRTFVERASMVFVATSGRDGACDVSVTETLRVNGRATITTDRAELPTNGEMHEELRGGDFDAEEYDRERAERYARREGFY